MSWFGLGMWLFFAPVPLFDIADNHAKILMWVFIILTFIPFIFYMNQEIRHESKGMSWTTLGQPPTNDETRYEKYRKELKRRTRNQRRRRTLL